VKIKKLLSFIIVLMIAFCSLSACATSSTTTLATLSVSSEASDPSDSSYENNLSGLTKYLTDSELLAGDATEMQYDFIGAIAGQKYSFKYNSVTISCELYEFDLTSLNDTASGVLDFVKENGTFTVMDKQVSAKLSDSGKFMMIYTNANSKDSTQSAFSDRLNTKFEQFKSAS
jgi:hypothetical protein